jgi:pimeloyl-ACP methyl ester carboxylesterase/molybdopterin converting factor small subunit
VLVPGFSEWSQKPGVRRAVAGLAQDADVIQLDLRGHGGSKGRSTLSDREVLDVDAAVAYARNRGYRRVVTVGFSMGGSAVLRHAALIGAQVHGYDVRSPVDAVVTVSTGSAWYIKDTKPMRRLHFLVLTRVGRLIARCGFKVRVDPKGWQEDPLSPLEAAKRVRVPRLVVHGDSDPYLTISHGQALAATAGGPVQLWVEEGFGHAEEAAGPDLLARISAAIPALTENAPVDVPVVTVHYWAAARDAAGCASEQLCGATLADLVKAAAERHGPELARLLGICSFLVDGVPVKRGDAATRLLSPTDGQETVVEVLPPFAGG